MKKVLTMALALMQMSYFAHAVQPKDVTDDFSGRAKIENSCAYIIEIPGKITEPGFYSPSKTYRIPKLNAKDYSPNVIKIKTKSYLPTSSKNETILSYGLSKILAKLDIKKIECPYAKYADGNISAWDKSGVTRIYHIEYGAAIDPYEIAKELMQSSEVEYAVPEFYHYISYTPNDPSFSQQYALKTIQADKAWDITKGSSTVVIGIVDNAIDYTHNDLTKNIWSNPYETLNTKDDDGNGYIDDTRGWDFYYGDNDVKAKDLQQSHGTHVAGCAAAVTNNSLGIAGTAGNCKILPVKIGSDYSTSSGLQHGYEAILYASRMKAQVINCSWGGPGSDPSEQDIINQAVALGSTIVVASGNETQFVDMTPTYPASLENIITVGATDSQDNMTYFSNFGASVDVYAPGFDILSTVPGNAYEKESGTSMASPITAGVAALIKSVFPGYTPAQVKEQLRVTCDNISNNAYIRGRINAYKAVSYNNTAVAGKKSPGCMVKNYSISGSDKISDNNEKTIRLKIKNQLSDCSNLKVTLSSTDKFVEIPTKTFTVGALASLAEKDLDIKLTVNANNTWYDGDVQLMVNFSDGDYTDTKLVQIPIFMSSTSKYTFDAYVNPKYSINWSTAHSYDGASYWAVGQSTTMGQPFFINSAYNQAVPLQVQAYGVFGFNNNKAIITVSPSNGQTQLQTTTNSGQNWESYDTKHITPFINGIHFTDNQYGIIIGDPISGVWGLAKTSDAGENWIQSSSIPQAETGETGLINANCFNGLGVWFGSTKGKVYYSPDFGDTWSVTKVKDGATIEKIAFTSPDSGMVVYYTTNAQTKYLAYTFDGGQTWKLQSGTVGNLPFDPVYYSTIKNSRAIIALSKMGEIYYTIDFGAKWSPILDKRAAMVHNGFLAKSGTNSYTMYQAGNFFGHCTFTPPIDNVTRILDLGNVKEIKFDTVEVGSSLKKTISISNKGNSKITITYAYNPVGNVGAKEFSNIIGTSATINPGATGSIIVKFAPEKIGLRPCKLVVSTDGTPADYSINLTGYGKQAAVSKLISVNNVSKIVFDSTKVEESSSKTLSVTNNGNASFTISELQYDTIANPIKEFALKSPTLPITIAPGVFTTLTFDFKPTGAEGMRNNTLHIISDATPSDLEVALQGYAKKNTSVEEEVLNSLETTVSPNPTKDVLHVAFNSALEGDYQFEITNSLGESLSKEVKSINSDNLDIDVRTLANGAYYLRIKCGSVTKVIKFVVSK